MSTLTQFSWWLHSNDEDSNGSAHDLSVNWVMPSGSENVVANEAFWEQLGDLIWPWKLDIVAWYGISRNHASITPLAIQSMSSAPVNILNIQEQVKSQIQLRISGLASPFKTVIPDDNFPAGQPIPSCLPSEFAPLTHLPAGISDNILGMTRKLSIAPDIRSTFFWLAPEFKAVIQGKSWLFTPISSTPGSDDLSVANVAYRLSCDDTEANQPFHFSVYTNNPVAFTVTPVATLETCSATTLSAQIAALAPLISPLVLIAKHLDMLASPPYPTITFDQAFTRLLGCGILEQWQTKSGEAAQPHVASFWELFTPQLDNADRKALSQPQSGATLAQLVAFLTQEVSLLPGITETQRDQLIAMTRILWPLCVVFLTNEGGDTIDSQRVRAFYATVANLIADASTLPVLLSAWLSLRATRYFAIPKSDSTSTLRKCNFHELWLEFAAVLTPQYAGMLLMYPVLKDTDSTQTPLKRKALAQLRTQGVDSTESARLYAIEALLTFSGEPRLPGPAAELVSLLQQTINGIKPEIKPALPEDQDLSIEIEIAGDTKTPDALNQHIRGYAVGMAAGYSDHGTLTIFDALGCGWISDVACRVKDPKTGKWTFYPKDENAARLHETVGAIRERGRQVVSFTYQGKPLCAGVLGDKTTADAPGYEPHEPDDQLALDFCWPSAAGHEPAFTQLPQLAYGLEYAVVTTAISNAGKVLTSHFADQTDNRKLVDLKDSMSLFPLETFRYLSRVAPGVPLISCPKEGGKGELYRYSDQTRSWVYQRQRDKLATPSPVALIRPDNSDRWKGGATNAEFLIHGPDATPRLIERWLRADWAALTTGNSKHCDLLVENKSTEQILTLQSTLLTLLTKRMAGQSPPRHPMVRAFGVTVQFYDAAGNALTEKRYQLNPPVDADKGYISSAGFSVILGETPTVSIDKQGKMAIVLLPGWAAKVLFASLVPVSFYCPADVDVKAISTYSGRWPKPLHRMDWVGTPVEWINPNDSTDRYQYYSQYEHWFECASEMSSETIDSLFTRLTQLTEINRIDNDICTHVGMPAATEPGLSVEHLSGLYIERHEWHWTGYPLAFAHGTMGEGKLANWAGPFLGTESLRDGIPHRFHNTPITQGEMRLPADKVEVLSRYPIPPLHGAKYAASLLRPVWRYEAWRKLKSEHLNKVLGIGGLVAARVRWGDPSLRLPPPTVKYDYPLTRTFKADNSRLMTTANGSALILDDVLYRTDPGEQFGGVSETLQVELVETRVSKVYEIGGNPTFHAGSTQAKAGAEATLPYPATSQLHTNRAADAATNPWRKLDWGIEAGAPFGLTYDLDRNPRVAQTAVIVRPTGTDVHRYWIMAQVRLRRMFDPSELWTESENLADSSTSEQAYRWTLHRRQEGNEWVPHDWCLDIPANCQVQTLSVAGGSLQLASSGESRRLIGSWHKGQWKSTADNLWGLQVVFQCLSDGNWTQQQTMTAYESAVYLPLDQCRLNAPIEVKLDLSHQPALVPVLRRVLLSDYTEPRWLTFIAMPYRNLAFANEHYCLVNKKLKGDSKDQLRLKRTSTVTNPTENQEYISRDLLLNPVNVSDFANCVDEREEAEQNSFHLLFLFERIDDIALPQNSNALGALKTVCYPTRAAITENEPYPPIVFKNFSDPGKDIDLKNAQNLTGFIYRFHRAVANDNTYPAINNWAQLVGMMFPSAQGYKESPEAQVRWTPEYLGPIIVSSGSEWQVPKPETGAVNMIRVRFLQPEFKLSLLIDPDWGWRLEGKIPAKSKLFCGRKHGQCRVTASEGSVTLELVTSGNCLLACLKQWDSVKRPAEGDMVFFDGQGKLTSTSTWQRD